MLLIINMVGGTEAMFIKALDTGEGCGSLSCCKNIYWLGAELCSPDTGQRTDKHDLCPAYQIYNN